MRYGSLLHLNLVYPVLQIVTLEFDLLHAGHKERRFGEEVLHLLKRTLGRLGKDRPEENCVGEIADLENNY